MMMWGSWATLVRCPLTTGLRESRNQMARGSLMQTLHLQIRQQRPKCAKVTAWHIRFSLHVVCEGVKEAEQGKGRKRGDRG